MTERSRYGGWPLTPSKHFPKEKVLTCPKCGSQDITLKTEHGGRGTGPGGRNRVGDPGSRDVAVCDKCGAKAYLTEGEAKGLAGRALSQKGERALYDIRHQGKLVTSVIAHSPAEARDKALREAYMLGDYSKRAVAINVGDVVYVKPMPKSQDRAGRASPRKPRYTLIAMRTEDPSHEDLFVDIDHADDFLLSKKLGSGGKHITAEQALAWVRNHKDVRLVAWPDAAPQSFVRAAREIIFKHIYGRAR